MKMKTGKKKNVDLVYSAMKTMSNDPNRKWNDPLPFEEIQRKMKPMGRRALYRYLHILINAKPPRVFRIRRGMYIIDFAKEQYAKERKELNPLFSNRLFTVDNYVEIKGRTRMIVNEHKVGIPGTPIFGFREIHDMRRRIEKSRLQLHGDKTIARSEANAFINSLVGSISCKGEASEDSLKIGPESLFTTDKNTGTDAFILVKATEIVMALLQSLRSEGLEMDDEYLDDLQLSVTINFNLVKFIRELKYFRDVADQRLNEKKIGHNLYKVNETYEKRIFREIFDDQPNQFDEAPKLEEDKATNPPNPQTSST